MAIVLFTFNHLTRFSVPDESTPHEALVDSEMPLNLDERIIPDKNNYHPNTLCYIKKTILESFEPSDEILPFVSTIEFYRQLQKNGFIDYTREPEFRFGQLHPIALRNNMGMEPTYWSVLFAFYDINGDGQPELIIAATGEGRLFPYIVGIYALVEGVPVPVIQYDGSRMVLSLKTDTCGNAIIEHSWGHGGSSEQLFYRIDENGGLMLLDFIISYDFDKNLHYLTGEMVRPRIRYIENVEIHLTEMEYIELMYKYGSGNYELFHIVSEDEFIDWMRINHLSKYEQYLGFGDSRRINFEWEYVLPLEHSTD